MYLVKWIEEVAAGWGVPCCKDYLFAYAVSFPQFATVKAFVSCSLSLLTVELLLHCLPQNYSGYVAHSIFFKFHKLAYHFGNVYLSLTLQRSLVANKGNPLKSRRENDIRIDYDLWKT